MILRTLPIAMALAAALTALAAPASAQDIPNDPVIQAPRDAWSFAAGAGTDNRSKGLSKSDGEPYVWGQAEWTSASGLFYVSPAFETINSSLGSELEVELGGGMRPQVWGFDLDLNATHKWQLDPDISGGDTTAWEFTADVKRSIGPAAARVRLQYSPDGTGNTEAWTWVEARVGWEFTDRLSATAAVGRRDQDMSVDYSAWNAGVTYDLTDNLEFDLRWYDNDADVPTEQYSSALVAGVSVYF